MVRIVNPKRFIIAVTATIIIPLIGMYYFLSWIFSKPTHLEVSQHQFVEEFKILRNEDELLRPKKENKKQLKDFSIEVEVIKANIPLMEESDIELVFRLDEQGSLSQDPYLILALVLKESSGRKNVIHPKTKARGYGQFLASSWAWTSKKLKKTLDFESSQDQFEALDWLLSYFIRRKGSIEAGLQGYSGNARNYSTFILSKSMKFRKEVEKMKKEKKELI